MLENFTNKQLLEWYNSRLKQSAINNGLITLPKQHGQQSLLRHDLWSLYDYGGVIKIVYFKSLPDLKDPRKDPLFPEPLAKKKPKFERSQRSDDERFSQSLSRSKSRIFELAMCNEFKYFCTFTQDEKMRDRFDLKAFRKDFAMLVRNLNRGRSEADKIKYLLIPEKHKDGAWHMHGLLKGISASELRPFELSEKLPYRIRASLEKGEAVYDWTAYRQRFGFFTCTEIKNGTACAKYVTKYITKDLLKAQAESGAHLFFASQGLNGRETVVKQSGDICPVTEWDFENDFVKVVEIAKPDFSAVKI